MPHEHMPERLTTTLDGIDFDGLVKRLRRVREVLKGCVRTGGGSDLQASMIDMKGTYVSFRRTTHGMQMNVDPSAESSSITILEAPLPNHGSTMAPTNGAEAAAIVARWIAMLSLPRYRTWANQSREDDPYHVTADIAGSMLACLNPDAVGTFVKVPVPNPYGETGQVSQAGRPVFARAISDRLTSLLPVTARLSRDDTHSYEIGAPEDVSARCGEPDTITRLRLLADAAAMAKPLLKAGLEAGR